MEPKDFFASRIKKLRTAIGLSQRALVAELGVSQQAYQCYETGRKTPSLDVLLRIARFFGVSLDYLLGLSDDQHLPRMDEETKNLFLALRALKGNAGTAQ